MKKLFFLFLFFSAILSNAQTKTTISNGLWYNSANWNPVGIPGKLNDVNITRNITSVLTGNDTVNSIGFSDVVGTKLEFSSSNAGEKNFVVQTSVSSLNFFDVIINNHIVFKVSGNYSMSGTSGLRLKSGSLAIIYGNFSALSSDSIIVESGAELLISGSMLLTNDMNLVIDGILSVDSLSINGASPVISIGTSGVVSISKGIHLQNTNLSIANSGQLDIGGDVYVTGSPNQLTVVGNMTVAGDMDVSQSGLNVTVNSPGILTVDGTLDIGPNTILGEGTIDAGIIVCTDGVCNDQITPKILPIELIFFSAIVEGIYVVFTWETASELNNDYFTIEQSFNTVDFYPVARIQGAGTVDYNQHYSYTSTQSKYGLQYFRLSQTDYDGTQSSSNIISVVVGKRDEFLLQTNDYFLIDCSVVDNPVSLEIYNINGSMIDYYAQPKGFISVSVSDFRPGIYFIQLSGKTVITNKISVIK